ncbi:MAG: UDP-N-acetylglucosamine 2-epimerase (non-hydrolyzing) [candidate division KSB1 bacterium]|nr:UDP-N-acetylglucosamine 2-epimerase (non-hydrolyzing) [candidate division KSB1 bacterium]
MIVANVVGARPNFMKIAPIHRRMLGSKKLKPLLIHTGQHYDEKMSKAFFEDLQLPEPDIYLGVGSGSHARQTAEVMIRIEQFVEEKKPDLMIVVGDVNSTPAAALAAVKMGVPVAHVEAGLRSFDRTMPEEINRIVTDAISDLLFVSEPSGVENLKREGVADDKIYFVGNVMIDSLVEHLQKAAELTVLEEMKVEPGRYALITLHRPSNVDNQEVLQQIFYALDEIQQQLPIVFPMHPRTRKMIAAFGMEKRVAGMSNLRIVEPLAYLPFLRLMSCAKVVLTDSGGIQEETTYLKIPCLTMRKNTERPITVTMGTNRLVGMNPEDILRGFSEAMNGFAAKAEVPPLWDGRASQRIVETIERLF